MPGRFSWTRIAASVAIAATVLWAAITTATSPLRTVDVFPADDLQVYERVQQAVKAGEPYYPTAVKLHRRLHFPLRPAWAVRLPTLAHLQSFIPPQAGAIALLLLNAIAWMVALPARAWRGERIAAGVFVAVAGYIVFLPRIAFVHDLWAGLLLGLALVLYRTDRWWPTFALTAAAVAIREHALLFACVFGALALVERRWREVAAWIALAAAFFAGMALHAMTVALLTGPQDMAAQSWFALMGPRAFVADMVMLTPLRFLPAWLAGAIAVMPMFGWLALRSPLGWRAVAVFAQYWLFFSVFGRLFHYYWGLLVLPTYMAGLAFLPRLWLRSGLLREAGVERTRQTDL